MAHFLVADYFPGLPDMLSEVLELEGHWVTCASDLWQLLSTARATLHPMIVMFNRSVTFIQPDADTDEYPITIMQRYEADLCRHKWIEMSTTARQHSEETLAFFDRLGVRHLELPFSVAQLLDLVDEVAYELDPTGRP